MAAPINILEARPPITGTVNLSEQCGGSATRSGIRGFDRSDWLLGSNFGYNRKLWGADQLLNHVGFNDSGTPVNKTNAFSNYQVRAVYLSDDIVDNNVPEGQVPTINGAGNYWVRYNIPQINSGLRWTFPADQKRVELFFSGHTEDGDYTVKTSLSDGSRPDATLALGRNQVTFAAIWRAKEPGSLLTLEIRKTNAGAGLLGPEFMYIKVPQAPARPRGFAHSLAHRAAFGGRNE